MSCDVVPDTARFDRGERHDGRALANDFFIIILRRSREGRRVVQRAQ
jgi:hypothetical protein